MTTRQLPILVVDDNRDAVDSLVDLLTVCGFDATGAYSGAEALQRFQERRPAVVFLDLSMPDLNGFEVLVRLRALQGSGELRIIALSADAVRLKQRIHDAGFDSSLSKPASMEQILQAIAFETS